MKRRWIVPIGPRGLVEVSIEKEGELYFHAWSKDYPNTETVRTRITEADRLDLIDALKAAGRSRAGVKHEPVVLEVLAS